jgi:Putative Flp pilus-assembly TadE/G-like
MTRIGDERGQTTVLVFGLTMVVLAVTGVAVDGTRAFLFRRTLQSVADASALAAAGKIDRTAYYVSGGRDLVLDTRQADDTARSWLAKRGFALVVNVRTNTNEIQVTARGSLSSTFLSLLGVRRIPVTAEAVARPVAGAAP